MVAQSWNFARWKKRSFLRWSNVWLRHSQRRQPISCNRVCRKIWPDWTWPSQWRRCRCCTPLTRSIESRTTLKLMWLVWWLVFYLLFVPCAPVEASCSFAFDTVVAAPSGQPLLSFLDTWNPKGQHQMSRGKGAMRRWSQARVSLS